MWEAFAIVAWVLFVLAACACAYLMASRKAMLAERDQVKQQLQQADEQVENDRQEIREQEKHLTEARAQLEGLDEKFKTLAVDALRQNNEQFLQLANESFKGKQQDAAAQLEHRKQAIDQMLKPIHESLDKHAKAVGEIEKNREGAYQSLRQQLSGMVGDQKNLRDETANLVKALRKPEVRGRWGEMQLQRVVELSGMSSYCDFGEQVVGQDRLRPDMVVHLPAGRDIVVDCKTPIDAYLDATEATDEITRDVHLKRHVKHVENHITALSSKQYQSQFARTPDFVVLFIPGEVFLEAALQRKLDLLEYAFNRNIIIAGPSTLIALLKAVHVGWREEQVAESAKHIKELGQELHERIVTATDHVEKLGKGLEGVVKAYNAFVGSYESRIVSSARKFKELGADSHKELPAEGQITQVEMTVRELKTFEQ